MGQKCYFDNPLVAETNFKENEIRRDTLIEIQTTLKEFRRIDKGHSSCIQCGEIGCCPSRADWMKNTLEHVWEIVK